MGTYNIQEFTSNECLNQLLFVNDLYVPSGKIQGHSVVHKYGHNLDVQTSYETLWSNGGNYSYLTSATTLTISSSDANDDDGDAGARTVLVQGLNSDYSETEEIVTLNGQTAVSTTKEYLRVFRMIVQSAGSSNHNEGIIYAGTGTVTSGVPANVYAEIPAEYNQTMMAVYTVPANKTAYMTMFYAQPDDNKGFQTQLLCGDESGLFRVKNQLHAFQSQANFNYRPYLKIEEKKDIELRVKIDQGTAEFGGGFSLILIDNN
tara:strand:- start:50 stop:832 length:783 start_codon:yes stop_codon:yes gene_type:complete